MEFHEIAELFPMMQPDELEDLVDDIEQNGLIEPIVLYEDKILDGRNRYLACGEAGIKPHYEYYKGDQPVSYVVSKNIKRRHLNASQKAMIATEFKPLLEEEAEKRSLANLKQYRDTDSELVHARIGRSDDKAGELFGVSGRYVSEAEKIKAEAPEYVEPIMQGEMTIPEAKKKIKHEKLQKLNKEQVVSLNENRPIIQPIDIYEWLPEQDQCDLLITDPPYMTDLNDVRYFSQKWLPIALNKVKDTGRAYVCVGPYPEELLAYLSIKTPDHLILANILPWTYRNTIGPSPKYDYKNNWQAILYFRGINAPELNCPVMVEQFTVQDISAPDGRQGDRFHKWQKPDELARRLISHSTKEGDLVLDPFAGTGTFLIAASKLNRVAIGCDNDFSMIGIAEQRGCEVA